MQVMPEAPRGDMPQRVGEVVSHHLGVARCARGEIHQRDVAVAVGMRRADERCSRLYPLMKVLKAFGHKRTYRHQLLDAWRLRQGIHDVPRDNLLSGAYNHFDVGSAVAVYNVFLCQKVGCRYDHCPYLVEGNDGKPKLIPSFQYEHHHVALADAEALEIGCRHVGISFHVGKGEVDVLCVVVGPAHGLLLRLFLCPCVHNVVSEVEVLGHLYLEVFSEILLRGKARLSQKSL